MNCLNCKEELTNPRAKYCSDKCRMAYVRANKEGEQVTRTPEQPTRTEEPEQVPEKTVRPLDLPDGTHLSPVDVKKLSKDDLYDAIDFYQNDEWVLSPEFVELKRRLNKWDYKKLEEEGYKIPAWLYHKHNKNLNAR